MRKWIFSTALLLTVGGLALAGALYVANLPTRCAPGEHHIICLRSWLAVAGSIVASIALFVALTQLWLARDSTHRQLRAYVGLVGGGLTLVQLDVGGTGFAIDVLLKNAGATPAYDFTTWFPPPTIAEADASPFGPPLPFDKRTAASIVFKDGDVHLRHIISVSGPELADIRLGKKKVFVWGGADYKDAFGVKRTLKFFDINGAESHNGSGSWALQPHRLGYVAD